MTRFTCEGNIAHPFTYEFGTLGDGRGTTNRHGLDVK